MAKIGVELALQNVKQALQEKGHQVVDLRNESDFKQCDCCVITGLDSNVMGMQETLTKSSIIEASGMSAEEVCQEVENRIS
ncbi:YkuS family protein [Bacillus sp. REN10]|uniref:YkuS family protein n=1 Tax=Bacillus sp. REN10 TaxID=2782541 RepID=UPI00193BB147|nr:YkuS family protein [Bacillus sp. REN10]